MTRIRVLGCSGGIGDGQHTTSFLVDGDVLIDAGSGVMTLSRTEMRGIDHVLALPLLDDSVGEERSVPLVVHALPAVIAALKQHLFNNQLWPDFSRIPSVEAPFMRFSPIGIGETWALAGRVFTPRAARHGVPACAWEVAANGAHWLFSGDTAGHPEFWHQAASFGPHDHVVVEASFPNAQAALANLSGHYHPIALAHDWQAFGCHSQLWISHLKPGGEVAILDELERALGRPVQALQAGQVFQLSGPT